MNAPAAPSRLWVFWCVALLGLAADQATKYGIFTWLYSDGTPRHEEAVYGFDLFTRVEHREVSPREPFSTREWKLAPGTFDIVASYTNQQEKDDGLAARLRTVSGTQLPYVNRGALFGWGGGRSDGQDLNTLFALVSFIAAVGITYWSTRPSTRRDWLLCAALGLILAGTLGNLYDRLVFSGVRDFLHWYRYFDWPVFNIADCCLVIGAGLLLAHAFFTVEREADEGQAEAQVHATEPAAEQAAANIVSVPEPRP
jgi:lipoprotein signal peptidase